MEVGISGGQRLQERSSDLMANGRPVFEKKAEASNGGKTSSELQTMIEITR